MAPGSMKADRLVSSYISNVTDAAGASSDGGSKEEENPLRISSNKVHSKLYAVENVSEWKISASLNRQASPEV